MPQLFVSDPCPRHRRPFGDHGRPCGDWAVAPFDAEDGDVLRLSSDEVSPLSSVDSSHPARADSVQLRRSQESAEETWVLLCGVDADVRVNGLRVAIGLVVLQDRDEISVGSRRFFFSTERLARTEPFPGADRPTYCARCKKRIEESDDAVACPICHIWHHQTADLPCWTYSDRSACGCGHPTAFSTRFRWTPDRL